MSLPYALLSFRLSVAHGTIRRLAIGIAVGMAITVAVTVTVALLDLSSIRIDDVAKRPSKIVP